MEHRWGERVRVDLPVRITAPPFAVRQGRLMNLSVSGASIKADFKLRPLSRIQVFIELPQRIRSDARGITAYVTRSSDDLFGIEWCEFAPPAVSELLQSFTSRRHIRLRKHEQSRTIAMSRLSEPLLKHGT